jgi:hypothetical protein
MDPQFFYNKDENKNNQLSNKEISNYIEKYYSFNIKNLDLLFDKSKKDELFKNSTKIKVTINVGGNKISFDIKKDDLPNLAKEVKENVEKTIKESNPTGFKEPKLVDIILSDEDKPTNTVAITFALLPEDRKEEFEANKDNPIIVQTQAGYYIFSRIYDDTRPIQIISREYIPNTQAQQLQSLLDILTQIKNSQDFSKDYNLIVNITLEDYSKSKENKKIVDELSKWGNENDLKLEIRLIPLTTKRLSIMIENKDLSSSEIKELVDGLKKSKTENGLNVFSDSQLKELSNIKTKNELIEFLLKENKEMYFTLKTRQEHPIIENFYSELRTIEVIPDEKKSSVYFDLEKNQIINPANEKIKIERLTKNNIYPPSLSIPNYIYTNQSFLKADGGFWPYALNKGEEFGISVNEKPIFHVTFIPKNAQEELVKPAFVYDESYHVEKFFKEGNKLEIFNYLKNKEFSSELIKNDPYNYNKFFTNLNNLFKIYLNNPESLNKKDKEFIEKIKKDGLVIFGDLAITDKNDFVDNKTLKDFKYYSEKLGIKIKIVAIAPDTFKLPKSANKATQSIDNRIEQLSKTYKLIETTKTEKNFSYKEYSDPYNSFIIIHITPDQAKNISKEDLFKILNFFN